MERQRKEESSGQRGQCEQRNDARAQATGRNHSHNCGDEDIKDKAASGRELSWKARATL